MFDIGFSEMIVCAVVALVVIGPERLPRVARTLGVLFGRLQRYVTQVKADINRDGYGRPRQGEDRVGAPPVPSRRTSSRRRPTWSAKDAQTALEAGPAEPAAVAAPEALEAQSPPASPQLELGIEEPPAQPRKEG